MNTPLLPKGNELNCHRPDHVTRISMCVWCDHLGHDSIGIGDTRVMVVDPVVVNHLVELKECCCACVEDWLSSGSE